MNFIFAWQKQRFTHSLRSFCHSKIKFMREWVKYCFCHAKIKFISLRHRVISSIRKMLLYNCKQGFKQSPSESIKREFFWRGGGGVIFAGIALKLEKVGPAVSSFNSCPSLPLDDRKQFQCLPIYWTITFRFHWWEDKFKGLFTRRWATPDRWVNMWLVLTYHVKVIKLKSEIIWTGGWPYLSRLPHLTGAPHLLINRPWRGVYIRKLAAARVSYRDDFLISYRVYIMTGSFHMSLFEGKLHVDKIHVWFKIANITHALHVPVYRQTDFIPKRVVVSRLHDTVASHPGVM